ncbi:hypothetical protein ASE48_29515 [Mycobacterium sp. Root265]|uniref:DUF4333 domain-containing protein n=1 Tax=Mycobacterium sp. Root265 TaxID=1736504 RepID=UPI00070A589A|nr:DUF4333 domain-containing protein [Mycobacterium sp. Root265]KRD14813.1 hypothetical protein ASE48_29515 [Mycobacterium sp. Root265]
MPRWSTVAPALVAMVMLGSCSVPTDKSVSRERVQDQIVEEVTEQSGAAPDSVSCPGDLAASVGATLECTLADDGQQRHVSVTVGSAEGDQVDLHIEQTIGRETVAEQIAEQIGRQIGRAPQSVTCPADLGGNEGATLRCELRDAGKTYGVTVTTVNRGEVTFDIKVDEQPR